MKNNTVIVAFSRMNPPTIRHLKLINKLKSLADEKSDVKARLYLSHSHDDKKNPLMYEEKIDFATVAFGDKVDVMESDAKTIYSVLAELYREGFENVVYVCGEDRFDEFQGIKEYNGKKTTKIGRPIRDDLYYEFDNIEIENAGHRDDNSENPEEKASASYVRKLAVEGDFVTFSEYVPFDNRTAMNLFKLLRKRLASLDGNIVKIVDRTEFSSANRDSDILAGWEHPHDKVQESLNLFDRILSLKEACFSAADIEKVSDGYMDAVLDDILNADSIKLGPNGEEKDSVDLNELRSDFGENLDIEVNKIYDLKDDTGKYPKEKTKKLFDSIFGKYFTWTDIFKGKYSGYDESKMATDIQESIQGIFLAINMLGLSETITDDMIFDSKNEIYHGKINGINCVKLDKIDLNNYKTQMKKLKNILYIDLPEELKSLDKNFMIVQPDGLSDNRIDKNIVKKLFATGFKFISSSNVSLDKDTFAPADIYVINLNKLDELKSQIDSLGKEIEASKFVELTNTLFNEKIAIPISLKMSSNPSFYRIINTDASTLSYFGLDDIKEIFFNPTGNSRIVLSYNDHNENKEAILEFRRKGTSATSWQCNANIKGNSDAYDGGSVKTYMKITFESDMEGIINKNELNKILSYPKFAKKIKGKPICALGKGASSESSQFGNVGLGMTCKELMNHEKTSKIKINGKTKNYDDLFTYIIQHAFKKAPDIQNTLKIM